MILNSLLWTVSAPEQCLPSWSSREQLKLFFFWLLVFVDVHYVWVFKTSKLFRLRTLGQVWQWVQEMSEQRLEMVNSEAVSTSVIPIFAFQEIQTMVAVSKSCSMVICGSPFCHRIGSNSNLSMWLLKHEPGFQYHSNWLFWSFRVLGVTNEISVLSGFKLRKLVSIHDFILWTHSVKEVEERTLVDIVLRSLNVICITMEPKTMFVNDLTM